MPEKIVEIPGVGNISFPDTMSDDEIAAASEKLFKEKQGAFSMDAELGPVARFVEGAIRAEPVHNAVDFLSQLVTDPKAAGHAVIDPSIEYLSRAVDATKAGRPAAGLGEAASAVPLIGPYVRGGIDRMRGGDVAGGLGELSWLALPGAKKVGGAAGEMALDAAKASAPGTMNALADVADAAARRRMVDIMAPKVGANKVRFGGMADKVAGAIARDPQLSAFSRGGLLDKVETRLAEAEAGLDAAAEARGNTKTYPTKPIIAALLEKRRQLTAETVQGNQLGHQVIGVNGEPVTIWTSDKGPMGSDVVPSPSAGRVAQIDKAIADVRELGPLAKYEALRRIRESYDGPAKAVYSPAMTADYMLKQGEKQGAADVTGALRDSLSKVEPESAAANATYSLYRNAADVLRAAEETERVRPKVGRGIMARATGAMVGAKEGGIVGAGIGATVAAIADKAVDAAPTLKIAVARRLSAIADALRSGEVERAQQLTDRTVAMFPAVKTGIRLVGRGAAMGGRLEMPTRLAADAQDQTQAGPKP